MGCSDRSRTFKRHKAVTVQTTTSATNWLNGTGLGYDSNGNMTGWSTRSGSVAASYDIENRMTQIMTPSVTETYKYGPEKGTA
ncbi:hypothetical protein [Paludibaculum fermentans]|uniref:hypothetical protein n=1 Tax=Paludibaculum fermentans TaxID=1473598 RepID=UPI003EBD2DF5